MSVCRYIIGLALGLSLVPSPGSARLPELPQVRLELAAGGFLDPLPFDRSFVIEGGGPPGLVEIVVSFEEFYEAGYLMGERPDLFAAYMAGARALIDSATTGLRTIQAPQIRQLQRDLVDLAIETAPSEGRFRWRSLASPFGLDRHQRSRLVAPDGLLDLDLKETPATDRFAASLQNMVGLSGRQRLLAMEEVLAQVEDAIRSARIAVGPAVRPVPQQVRWRRHGIGPAPGGGSDPTADRWDRMTLRLEGGKAAGEEGSNFRLVAAPLKADRTYLVRLRTERMLSGAERVLIAGHTAAAVDAEEITATVSIRAAQVARQMSDGTLTGMLSMSAGTNGSDRLETRIERGLRSMTMSRSSNVLAATSANRYVGLDAGLLHVPELKKTSMYIGTNLYLRPVNKSVPLSQRGGLLRRFALTLGLSIQSIEDDRETRRNLFGRYSMVLGAGYRISQLLRISGGALVFRERDPETFPLTESTSIAASPYAAFSVDLDVGRQLTGIGGLFDFLKRGSR